MPFAHPISALHFIVVISIVSPFSPDLSSFDAYGLKLAANDYLQVESIPSQFVFYLSLAPYNYSLSCTLAYNDSNNYVYAVAVARQPRVNDSIRFVFIGVNTETEVPFIGLLTYTGVRGPAYVANRTLARKTVFPCDGWQAKNYRMHEFNQFASTDNATNVTNDFFVVAVEPTGRFAYAFNNGFLVAYDLELDYVVTQLGSLTWPHTSFIPYAVDISSDQLIVVVGYVSDSHLGYTPCAYLLNVSNATLNVIDSWLYTPPSNTSWQASLTNWDADVYSPKYGMSVSINDAEAQVLLGIPVVNTIFILGIDRIAKNFLLPPQSLSNGKAMGMGKAVGWLGANLTLVLVNTYSLSYVWSSSQVFIYNVSAPNSFVTKAILPNVQQTLAPTFGPILLSLVATQNGTVIMLDSNGNLYTLLPSPGGTFSDSSSGSYSSSAPCIGGTFTATTDICPCSLCPQDTTTNGLNGQFMCVPCESDAFCPLGSAFGNVSASSPLFTNVNQARAYPMSPQSTRFDNILMQNMFAIHGASSSHCLLVSPLFWAIIVISFGAFIWIIMIITKYYVHNSRGQKVRNEIKELIKRTDLIGEGELLAGGLASFSIIVLVVFAYTFSNAYYQRYPIENITDAATFACDPTLSNAQFSSNLMPLGIPPNDGEDPIFALLDAQPFTLYIDLINTLFTCDDVILVQIKDRNVPLTILSCNKSSNSLSLSTLLPSHTLNLQLQLTGANTISGLRLGLGGPGTFEENDTLEGIYSLVNLASFQTFSDPGRLLTRIPSVTLLITKLINRTYGLSEGDPIRLSGIWLPSFTVKVDDIFVDENEYNYATSSSSVLSIAISETPYYTINTQKPITDQAELIFTNLLFTIVCLEIFGLGFLIFKLIILPLLKRLVRFCRRQVGKKLEAENLDLQLDRI